jgi:hypothetical protein
VFFVRLCLFTVVFICRYNDDVMSDIAQMAIGLTDEYRTQRREAVQRVLGEDGEAAKKKSRR